MQPVDRKRRTPRPRCTPARSRANCCPITERAAARPADRDGASLGALAMLHAHVRHPKSFDGLLLQSAALRQRYDKQESDFPRYRRISALSARCCAGPCRTDDSGRDHLRHRRGERANNEDLAAALTEQGYPAWLAEVRDGHTWTAWRDAWDPHLPALIESRNVTRRTIEITAAPSRLRHYGRPVVAFPVRERRAARLGVARDGDAIGELLAGGKVKLYCVPSSTARAGRATTCRSRARAQARPLRVVGADSARPVHPGGRAQRRTDRDRRLVGAYHAANFCLKRADLFPVAIA